LWRFNNIIHKSSFTKQGGQANNDRPLPFHLLLLLLLLLLLSQH
jgi:hypothetical protein